MRAAFAQTNSINGLFAQFPLSTLKNSVFIGSTMTCDGQQSRAAFPNGYDGSHDVDLSLTPPVETHDDWFATPEHAALHDRLYGITNHRGDHQFPLHCEVGRPVFRGRAIGGLECDLDGACKFADGLKFFNGADGAEVMDGLFDWKYEQNNYVHAVHLPGTGSEWLISDSSFVRHQAVFLGSCFRLLRLC